MPLGSAPRGQQAHIEGRGVHDDRNFGDVFEMREKGWQGVVLQVGVRVGLDDIERLTGLFENHYR